ncbi:MAG: TetR/AcrR family transcriptional regulator [Bacteroidia bacterium]
MTTKQESILNSALELFANEGYNAVSTSKIAKAAGVSEGLIFRHFGNKKGLLDALMELAEEKMSQLFGPIFFEEDPEKALKKGIEMPFSIPEGEHSFWRLQYMLKWNEDYYKPQKMKPVIEKMTRVFEALGYEEPEQESQMLNHTLESIFIGILRDGIETHRPLRNFLLKKYKL